MRKFPAFAERMPILRYPLLLECCAGKSTVPNLHCDFHNNPSSHRDFGHGFDCDTAATSHAVQAVVPVLAADVAPVG